jgi:nucleotide-binding universal stress UspA family protein
LPKALNAKVTVTTVTESLPPIYYGPSRLTPSKEDLDSWEATRKERASKVLDEARAMAEQSGISAALLHVSNEHPTTAIIETAKSKGCDLIVMASHGRDVLRKLLLGSQTSEVLASGTVPVLVVPRT